MTVRIRDICLKPETLAPDASVSAGRQLLVSRPELATVPIVAGGVPLGLLSRAKLMELFAIGPGSEVLARQPVKRFMQPIPHLADVEAPVSYIAKLLAEKGGAALQEGFLATENGHYAGYVPILSVLNTVANENAARAKAMQAHAAKLTEARKDTLAMRREQSRFMAFLGHEIRTPLTGILGIADLLADKKLDPEARDFARTISRSGQHLDHILSDFLDLSRLEDGKLSIHPTSFKVSDFVAETRKLWIGRADKKGIALKITLDDNAATRIEADATRLRQILFNLIGNAMKFTEKGAVSVHLQTRLIAKSALNLEMTVTDTGIGIADKDKARLFEAFEQATPQTVHKYGGTGLGLSIAKGLVDQMSGRITLSDNPEGGTVFRVICPVHKAGPRLAVENKKKQRSANLQLGRVLLVEDHDVSQFVISEALKAVGWQVDCVATVAQAQRRASEIRYQAILTDLHLGDQTGFDFIAALRGMFGPNQAVPVLAVSADVNPTRMRQCKDAGFTDFIEKPIRPRQLVAKLIDIIVTVPQAQENRLNLKIG